ncbi:protein JINGUBANG-like [Selaginella moellendorffii]|uniref:protein JINGUBANG-like n=1 Tax=Selaginella moellendorffii TaxID=88036 RepID=UPI000D1C8DDA|nr:protein JINGUBANG-like [Selaginella moellendorffii]|eukprot:XP_024524619.1 protein JINGUBANG-like [Selaginella moellendorffii]
MSTQWWRLLWNFSFPVLDPYLRVRFLLKPVFSGSRILASIMKCLALSKHLKSGSKAKEPLDKFSSSSTSGSSCNSGSKLSSRSSSRDDRSSASSSSSSSSRCDRRANLECVTSFPGDQAVAMALASTEGDHCFLYVSSNTSISRRIDVLDCSSRELSTVGSLAPKTPPVRAILASGARVFTAHRDMKIRVWTRRIAESQDELMVVKHELSATLPSLQDRMCFRSLSMSRDRDQQQQQQHHSHRLPRRKRRSDASDSTKLVQHRDAISALAISSSGKILYSGSWDKSIKVWRIAASSSSSSIAIKCVESFTAHDDAVNALAVASCDGDGLTTLYSASASGEIRAWESSDHRKIKHRLAASFHDHSSAVNALLLSRDSTLLYSGSGDKTVRVWARSNENLHDLRVVEILRGHRRAVLCLAATIDGELLCSGSADKSVRIWRGHCCVAALDLHCAPVKSLAMARDRESSSYTVYSSALDGKFKIYTALP